MADKKVVPQGFVQVNIKELESIPAGSNPFHHDLFNMGTPINDSWIIMHTSSNQRPLPYMILVNSTTGQRIELNLDQLNEKQFFDQTGKAYKLRSINKNEVLKGKYIVHTQHLNNIPTKLVDHKLLTEIINIPLKVDKSIIQSGDFDYFVPNLEAKHFPVLGGERPPYIYKDDFMVVEDYDGYYSLFDSEDDE